MLSNLKKKVESVRPRIPRTTMPHPTLSRTSYYLFLPAMQLQHPNSHTSPRASYQALLTLWLRTRLSSPLVFAKVSHDLQIRYLGCTA